MRGYVEVLLDLEDLVGGGEGAFEEGGFKAQEGLLEFEALLAELDLDVASVVVREQGLQLLAGVRKTDLYLFVHHYMNIGGWGGWSMRDLRRKQEGW